MRIDEEETLSSLRRQLEQERTQHEQERTQHEQERQQHEQERQQLAQERIQYQQQLELGRARLERALQAQREEYEGRLRALQAQGAEAQQPGKKRRR